MPLEAGTFVEDLVITNPPSSDQKSQGDDHLRLIKSCLRNTFKRATSAFYIPAVASKSANYTILSTDNNTSFVCDATAGAFTLNLPSLVSGDAGFVFNVLKADFSGNPVFLTPLSSSINGYTKIRRSMGGSMTRVMWTGSAWIGTRSGNGCLIGQIVDFMGSTLPPGFLWCDGSTFSSVTWNELAIQIGTTLPDYRGRVTIGRDNMGVGDANRVTVGVSGIDGNSLFAAGGTEALATVGFNAGAGAASVVVNSVYSNVQPSCVCNKIMCGE